MTDDPTALAAARAAAFRVPPPRRGGRAGAVAVAVLAGAWLAVWGSAGAAWSGLPVAPVSVALLTFLPWLAAALAGLAFLLWTILPDRRSAAAVAVLSALPPLAWWGPVVATPGAAGDGTALRFVTWNVRRLWGLPDDERPSLACVTDELRALAPDALVLQEVTPADLTALDEALGLDCVFATYRARHQAMDAGLAVCAVDGAARLLGGEARAFSSTDDWRYVDARLDVHDREVRVLGVHLAPLRLLDEGVEALPEAATRLSSVIAAHAVEGAALAEVAADAGPVVVAGDFNSAPDTPLHAALSGVLRDALALRGPGGPRGTVRLFGWIPVRIDHIYVSPEIGVGAGHIPETACSDHRPVVADLLVPP